MLNIEEITAFLPQESGILVDRIEEMGPESVVGYKNVTMNEPHFRGHFPGAPVMPGVLTLEALVQLSWFLLLEYGPGKAKGKLELVTVDRLKFRRVVKPGDKLVIKVTLVPQEGESDLRVVNAVASVEDELAIQGVLGFRVLPAQD